MFQIKIGCKLKLAADNNNANLILIWLHRYVFSTKQEGSILAKMLALKS